MSAIKYDITVKGVEAFMDKLQSSQEAIVAANLQAMEKSTLEVEARAKAKVPRVTGRLFASITHEASPEEGRVGTNVRYAPFVEFGTGLAGPLHHLIYPTRARYMTWLSGDKRVFARFTRGMRAEPYLGPALDESRDRIFDNFRQAAQKLIDHLAD